MPKEKPKEEEVFFVGIKDPLEIRRSLLGASKDLLQYMQRFEEFKEKRDAKQQAIAELKDVTREIARLINKLKIELPKTKLRAKPSEETRKIAKRIPERAILKPKKVAEVPKEEKELKKLEAELAEIEERLTKLE